MSYRDGSLMLFRTCTRDFEFGIRAVVASELPMCQIADSIRCRHLAERHVTETAIEGRSSGGSFCYVPSTCDLGWDGVPIRGREPRGALP